MSTTATTRISCPSWCTISEQSHLEDLDGWHGRTIHHSAETAGWSLTSITLPDGTPMPETAEHAPVMLMDLDSVVHPDDAEKMAQAVLVMVQLARGERKGRQQ